MEEYSISDLKSGMENGKFTSRGIVEGYLDRIQRLDQNGPRVNSIIDLNPEALAIADSLDAERVAGKLRGPMHGIPVLLKDNIDTHDAMQTTAGSLALEGSISAHDAFIVKRLRAGGVVILGKTNLSEWANFRGKHSVSGWSSRGGLTRNPYALDRTACGSSSGSGAAVAANFCAAAVGTETDGSIICPSQTNGIVGIKPTLGLLSRSGIIPIAHSQDTPGPMGRTVADAAVLLGAMVGADKRDPVTTSKQRSAYKDYTKFLDPNGLKGARIGVARSMAGTDARVLAIFESCIQIMKKLGAVLIDPADVLNFNKFGKAELQVMHFEYKAGLNQYLASLGRNARVKSLEDLIKFNDDHKDRVMPYFGQEHLLEAKQKGSLASRKYLEALEKNHRLTRKEGIDSTMRKYRLDAILVPSGGPAWMIDLVNGDNPGWDMESTSVAAVAGYPHITVPAGYIFGLPIGLSFIGRAWQEPILIRLAYAFEQATKVRKAPKFLQTANLGE